MSGNTYVAAAVLISATITWALRAVPFAMLAPMRESALIRYLNLHMPLGVMIVLTVYTMHGAGLTSLRPAHSFATALAVTVGLHLWRRNALLSILGGTAVHVVLSTLTQT